MSVNIVNPDGSLQSVAGLNNFPSVGTAAFKDSTNTVTAGSTDLVESGAVKSAIDNITSNIAMTETTNVATVAHAKDSYFIDSSGQFVKATTDIAIGTTIAVGTNVTVTTIAEALGSAGPSYSPAENEQF